MESCVDLYVYSLDFVSLFKLSLVIAKFSHSVTYVLSLFLIENFPPQKSPLLANKMAIMSGILFFCFRFCFLVHRIHIRGLALGMGAYVAQS